jgi:flagellar protein FliO/FliZ
MQNYALDLVLTLVILFIVIGLAWLMLHTLKKVYNHSHKNDRMKLKLTLPIGHRERVVVVQYEGNDYVLGVTANQVSLIDKKVSGIQPNENGQESEH